jgi:threonine/homoserine/homoserine lactone efflux protein
VGDALGGMLPFAIGIALSPIPLIAVILMLLTPRATMNGLGFLLGWIAGVSVGLWFLTSLGASQDLGSSGTPSTTVLWIEAILGLLLVIGAIRHWRTRPGAGEEPAMPGWMHKVDSMGPGSAFGLAVLLSAVNPKNLLLLAGAAVVLVEAALPTGDELAVIAAFTIVASCTVAIPVVYRLVARERSEAWLEDLKTWLGVHNAAVMSVLLLVIGAKLLGDGLGGLL